MPSIRHRILLTMLVASCTIATSAAPAAAGTLIDDGALGPALGSSGTFAAPQGVALAPDGSLYVLEASGFRVVKFGPDKSFERMWGRDVKVGAPDAFEVCLAGETCKVGVQASNFGSAQGGEFFGSDYLAVAPDGTVYVADGRRVQAFSPDGQFLRMWGADVDSPDGGTAPEVCTVAASCLRGEASPAGGAFNAVSGIAVAANGDVIVADFFDNRVQRFGSSGNFVHAIGWDVVSESGSTAFEVCTVSATCKAGVSGPGEGQFQGPQDVAVKGAETLVASDNDYVQRFDAGGGYLGRFGGFALTPNPAGMDVSPAGEVFVVQDSGGPRGLHRFGTGYDYVEFLGGISNILLDEPDDVAVDEAGRAFVPQPFGNVVRRFLVGAAAPTPPGPTPPATPTPVPAPAGPPAPKPAAIKASTVITLPSTRRCVSRRNFRIRLRQPRGTAIAQAVVTLNGKKVRTVKGKRVTAPVDLRSLPKGRFTVKVTITTADGRRVSDTRRYRTCVPKKR